MQCHKPEADRQLRKTLQGITPHRLDTGLSRIGTASGKSYLKPSPGLHHTPIEKVHKKIRKE